jgi:integrase
MGRGKGVRAASNSSIGITFQYRGARCREKLKLPPNPANKKFAERLKATIEHEIATGTFDYAKHFPGSPRARKFARTPGAAISVAEQLRIWLDGKAGEVEPETWNEYEKDCRKHLMPMFGETLLADLTRQQVKAWAAGTKLSRKRLNNILIPLRSMLNEAVDQDPPLIPRNPLHGFELKRLRTVQTADTVDPFTQEEIAAILEHSDPEFADFIEFWCWTGPRLGEIIAFRWPDVDWLRRTIRVARAIREGRVKVPKTEAGEREVKLLPPAVAALERQKARTFLAGANIWRNTRTSEPWAGDGPIRKTVWVYALKRAGVRYRGPKQLRHTFASWMLSAGENPLWVANQMGHEDWSMIVRVYGRWIPDVDPLAGDRAVRAIYGTNAATRKENVK